MLRVLIQQLPPDSALHRARTGGHAWTWNEAILWQALHMLQVIDQRLVWQKRKSPRWPKWRQYPWERDGSSMGNRGEHSAKKVMDVLLSLRPGGGAKDADFEVDYGGGRYGVSGDKKK